jgi:hypothetical protein
VDHQRRDPQSTQLGDEVVVRHEGALRADTRTFRRPLPTTIPSLIVNSRSLGGPSGPSEPVTGAEASLLHLQRRPSTARPSRLGPPGFGYRSHDGRERSPGERWRSRCGRPGRRASRPTRGSGSLTCAEADIDLIPRSGGSGGATTVTRRSGAGRRIGAASGGPPIGRRREGDRSAAGRYSVVSRLSSSTRLSQRPRERARGRGRVDPPSRSAAKSSTISVPSDTIRVPSGSIDQSSLSGDCRDRMIAPRPGRRYRPKVRSCVRRMTYSWSRVALRRPACPGAA